MHQSITQRHIWNGGVSSWHCILIMLSLSVVTVCCHCLLSLPRALHARGSSRVIFGDDSGSLSETQFPTFSKRMQSSGAGIFSLALCSCGCVTTFERPPLIFSIQPSWKFASHSPLLPRPTYQLICGPQLCPARLRVYCHTGVKR